MSIIAFNSTIRVGPIELPNRVVLAPMSGVTDAPFRQRRGIDWAPVLSYPRWWQPQSSRAASATRCCVRDGRGVAINAVQLAGCEARWMGEGARIAEASGADIIDINMGCPAKHVTNGQSGSALMRDLDHALTLIEATVSAVRCRSR